jgi:hypothetical protein
MAATSALEAGTTYTWTRYSVAPWRKAPHSMGRVAGNAAGRWGWKPSSSRALVMAGMWAGSAARSRSMMFLPERPGTAELPTCSAGVAGQRVPISAIRRLATSAACGSAW